MPPQRVGGRIQEPRKVKNVTPEYPSEAPTVPTIAHVPIGFRVGE